MIFYLIIILIDICTFINIANPINQSNDLELYLYSIVAKVHKKSTPLFGRAVLRRVQEMKRGNIFR